MLESWQIRRKAEQFGVHEKRGAASNARNDSVIWSVHQKDLAVIPLPLFSLPRWYVKCIHRRILSGQKSP